MSITCPTFLASLNPSLGRAVVHYCERAGEACHAELLNAVTNMAFLVAGWAAWRLVAVKSALGENRLLAVVIAAIPNIGLGGLVVHTLATSWAEWVDVMPILVFLPLYLWLAPTHRQ